MTRTLTGLLGRAIIAGMRFRYVDTEGDARRSGVLIGAPHTSKWDALLMVGLIWRGGFRSRTLVAQEYFAGPRGWIVRWLDCIPVDRDRPGGLVASLIEQLRSDPVLGPASTGAPPPPKARLTFLAIAPEGGRSAKPYWHSGFYRIARDTHLPLSLAFVDTRDRTVGFGPCIDLTGDVVGDMNVLRAFYGDMTGLHPGQESAIALREEDEPDPDAAFDAGPLDDPTDAIDPPQG